MKRLEGEGIRYEQIYGLRRRIASMVSRAESACLSSLESKTMVWKNNMLDEIRNLRPMGLPARFCG